MQFDKTYSGDEFRNLVREYGIDRMKTDPKYRREVRQMMKERRLNRKQAQSQPVPEGAKRFTSRRRRPNRNSQPQAVGA